MSEHTVTDDLSLDQHAEPVEEVWAATSRVGLDFHALDGIDRTGCGRSTASVSSVSLTLAAALGRGMKPCPRCWPLGLPASTATASDIANDEHPESVDDLAGFRDVAHRLGVTLDERMAPAPLPKRTGRELSTVAANLAGIAADLENLGRTLREAGHIGEPLTGGVTLYLHPDHEDDDASRIAMVDALSRAVLGHDAKNAKNEKMNSGSWQHAAGGERGPISVHVLTGIANPTKRDELAEKDAEIERLRVLLAQTETASQLLLAHAAHAIERTEEEDASPATPADVGSCGVHWREDVLERCGLLAKPAHTTHLSWPGGIRFHDEDVVACVDCGAPAVVLAQPLHGVPEGQSGPKCERHAGPQRELLGRPARGVVRHQDVTS